MNEPVALPAPDQPEPRTPEPQTPEPQTPGPQTGQRAPQAETPRRRDSLPIVSAIGFLILAGAIAYVWTNMVPADQVGAQSHAVEVANDRISSLESRLNQVSQNQSAVTPGEFAKLTARIDAMDGQLANQAQLASRVDTISGRIEALSGRIESVSNQQKAALDALSSQQRAALDNLSSQQKTALDTLSSQQKAALDAVKQQAVDMAAQVGAAQAAASNVQGFSQRLTRIAKLQEAALALSVGQPVGDVPGAPPALARYAHTAPPTEAELKQSYPQAQAKALATQQPDNASAPLGERMWERAQGLITVRHGDQVVVGDTTAIALNQAQAAVDTGDLPAAIKALETLKGDPAQAMAGWLVNAKGLVAARSALTQMADQA